MNITIGLVQINNGFQYYLPYSVALLQAYAQKHAQHPEAFSFLPLAHARLPLTQQVENLKTAQVVGFSTYIWNMRYSLALAHALKAQNPDVLIVFGGPQTPDKSESFLRQYPWVDICVHGEGEVIFLSILESAQNWEEVPGISYIDQNGSYRYNTRPPRIRDLDQIPSPYLTDIFEPLMTAEPSTRWLAAWETNRGCPFSCTFCDWGRVTRSKIYTFDLERVYREIDWLAAHQIEFILCCDANFGILKRDLEIAHYLAQIKRQTGQPGEVVVQNTKNTTDRAFEIHQILYDAGAISRVTLSLQSLDAQTLHSIKRQNISLNTFHELQHRFTQAGMETYTDVIIGLPGETYDSFSQGVSEIIANGQHSMIWFYNLYILPNAEVADSVYQQKHGIETVQTPGIYRNTPLTPWPQDTREIHEVVIATQTMPRKEWLRSRVFAWMTAFLHFGVKPLQPAFIWLHDTYGLTYRELIEAFSQNIPHQYPLLTYIREFFINQAQRIQAGEPEFCKRVDGQSRARWLSPEDDIMIHLYQNNLFEIFFREAQGRLREVLEHQEIEYDSQLLAKAISQGQSWVYNSVT